MATIAVMGVVDKYLPYIAPHFAFMNETTTQNKLYGGIDLDELSWLGRKWAGYYIWFGSPILATGALSFALHEVCRLASVWKM